MYHFRKQSGVFARSGSVLVGRSHLAVSWLAARWYACVFVVVVLLMRVYRRYVAHACLSSLCCSCVFCTETEMPDLIAELSSGADEANALMLRALGGCFEYLKSLRIDAELLKIGTFVR